MDTDTKLADYLHRVLGRSPRIRPLSERQQAALPLYLRSSYRFIMARIDETEFVFAIASESESKTTPIEYVKHVESLERALGQRVALVLPKLLAYERNRLVHQGIPFVVPERQLFLPTLFIDLHERFPGTSRRSESLSASAQAFLLYYLLGNEVSGVSLQDLARELGYSAMTLSNVRRELEDLGFSKSERQGRSLSIAFAYPRKGLWEMATGRLISPVKKRHWVNRRAPLTGALSAGTTALAELTLIGEDPIPTYAMHAPAWSKAIRAKHAVELQGYEEESICIEEWKYDPLALSRSSLVDPLSLYLSLKDSSDERVRIAIDEIIEGMAW